MMGQLNKLYYSNITEWNVALRVMIAKITNDLQRCLPYKKKRNSDSAGDQEHQFSQIRTSCWGRGTSDDSTNCCVNINWCHCFLEQFGNGYLKMPTCLTPQVLLLRTKPRQSVAYRQKETAEPLMGKKIWKQNLNFHECKEEINKQFMVHGYGRMKHGYYKKFTWHINH